MKTTNTEVQSKWKEYIEENRLVFLFADEMLSKIISELYILEIIIGDNSKVTIVGFSGDYGIKLYRREDSVWHIFVSSKTTNKYDTEIYTHEPLFKVLENFNWASFSNSQKYKEDS